MERTSHLKLKGTVQPITKYIFRKAMRDVLPQEVLRQPKAGFAAPIDYWLANDLKPMVDDLLSESSVRQRGLFQPSVLRRYVDEHRAGTQDWSMQIWQFLTLELWMQMFLDGGSRQMSSIHAPAAVERMKQVLQQARTGDVTVAEVPPPQLLPGCVLVRVAASLVSAGTERASSEFASKNLMQKAKSRPDLVSDVLSKIQRDGLLSTVHAVRSRLDQPSAPGYSSSGTVVAVDGEVKDIRVGDRVACAGAGYAVHAEYANIPRLLIARIPDDSSRLRKCLSTRFLNGGCSLFAWDSHIGSEAWRHGRGYRTRTARSTYFSNAASGGMHSFRARHHSAERANLAMQNGAHAACSLTSSEFRDLCKQHTHGAGVDSVLITAETPSSDPVNLSGEIARDRAIVVAVGTVGLDIQRKTYYDKELDFRISRSYGPGRYDAAYEQKGRDYPIGYVRWTETRNMEAFLRLLAERKLNLNSLITHRFPIDDAEKSLSSYHRRDARSISWSGDSYPGSEEILSVGRRFCTGCCFTEGA